MKNKNLRVILVDRMMQEPVKAADEEQELKSYLGR